MPRQRPHGCPGMGAKEWARMKQLVGKTKMPPSCLCGDELRLASPESA